jgi:hypothetical protein
LNQTGHGRLLLRGEEFHLAKTLIMLVRVLGVAAIVVGILLWVTNKRPYLGPHIGLGFCVAAAVFVMAVFAMIKGDVVAGVAGLLLAILLPLIGFMQLPLVFHAMGAVQVAHIALGLAAIGLAERLYTTIRRV